MIRTLALLLAAALSASFARRKRTHCVQPPDQPKVEAPALPDEKDVPFGEAVRGWRPG